jgi:YD repeat-containing protein
MKEELRKFILLLILFHALSAKSQIANPSINDKPHTPSIPPSPGAAALEKFTSIPVNFSTGVTEISYPFFSLERCRLSFSTSVSYHPGGNKVQDMASDIGLGWALNCGGRISRTIRGIRDDHPTKGYLYTPSFPETADTYLYDASEFYPTRNLLNLDNAYTSTRVITPDNTSFPQGLIRSMMEDGLDAEQDMFSYSTPSCSGRFVFNKNREIVKLEYNNIKITPVFSAYLNGQPNGSLISFLIVNENGIEYKFDHLLTQAVQTEPASLGVASETANSEWLLSTIRDPLTDEAIVITYTSDISAVKYETNFSQTQRYSYEEIGYDTHGTPYLYPNFHSDNDVISYSIISGGEAKPATISFPDGTVLQLFYDFERDDLKNANALTQLKVKNSLGETIKDFRFMHSYFDCTLSTVPLISANDYSKRLRLDEIREVATDGTSFKATNYFYNATPMNARDSRNLDYWGYNVTPARNNLEYVSKIRFGESPGFEFLPGADRRPDEVYGKAGVLERIVYPTGGFTSFEYENNKAFSDINYYENELTSNLIRWDLANFNNSSIVNLNGRTELKVNFQFKFDELSARPAAPVNSFISCLGQDVVIAKFIIESTDGSFATSISDTYGNFLSGKSSIVTLPLGKIFRVRFVYDPNVTCAYTYPFKASVVATYFITMQDKLAGGLRIKKIISNDNLENVVSKEYDYSNTDGHSSAFIDNIPNFSYYKTVTDVGTYLSMQTPSSGNLPQHHLNRSSEPVYSSFCSNGTPIQYARVTEKFVDGSSVIREYDPIVCRQNKISYPYTPGQEYSNLNALLKQEIFVDNTNAVVKENLYSYNKVITTLYGNENRSLKVGMVADAVSYNKKHYVAQAFWPVITRAELTNIETTEYSNGSNLKSSEQRFYNGLYNLSKTVLTTSQGKSIESEFKYPYDWNNGGNSYTEMVNKNILAPTISLVKREASNNHRILVKQTNNYSLWNQVPWPSSIAKSLLSATPENEITFDRYDASGNLLQFTGKDGVVNTFIWGYTHQYPVAKIIGSSYDNAITSAGINLNIINNPSNDVALRAELSKLRQLSGNVQVVYCTYKPLVGVSSETDANNRISYYEYDSFNRLRRIKDQDGNIVKVFDYQYQANP